MDYEYEFLCQPDNAKRSIPVHPTFVNDAHLDLGLQNQQYDNRVHPLTIVNMSAKFDEDEHSDLVLSCS